MGKFVLGFVSCLLLIASMVIPSSCLPKRTKLDNLVKIGSVKSDIQPIHSATIQLHSKEGFFCSAVVFDNSYTVTAAHCLDSSFGPLRVDGLHIKDEHGKDTGIIAIAAGVNTRVDFGIIKGDFRLFKKATLEVHSNGFIGGGIFLACGFPMGQNQLTCEPFVPKSNYYFHVIGLSALVPGMSGGPVVDLKTGKVVGVNSAVGEGVVFITPLTGLYGAFGIE